MKRSTLVALVIFAALLAVVLLVRSRPVERGSDRLSYAALDPEAIDRLTVVEGEQRVELEREGRAWRVTATGALADRDSLERALEGIQSIDTSEVVSTSPERHGKFGVDGDEGLTVTATAEGRTVADVVLGSPEGGGSYVRAVGRDTVFALPRTVRYLFPTEPARWAGTPFSPCRAPSAICSPPTPLGGPVCGRSRVSWRTSDGSRSVSPESPPGLLCPATTTPGSSRTPRSCPPASGSTAGRRGPWPRP
jgi:hypothetical protein